MSITVPFDLRYEFDVRAGADEVYACRCGADPKNRTVHWSPLPGVGNARIGGAWAITRRKESTHLVLDIEGEVSVALPGLMKPLVLPAVAGENERLVEQYIDNLIQRFGGEV